MIRATTRQALTLLTATTLLALALPGRADFSHAFLDQQAATVSRINGIDLNYRIVGEDQNPPVLMF